MDTDKIRVALSTLQSELERAREAKSQAEAIHGGRWRGGGYEEPEVVLAHILNYIHDLLLVFLEAAGLPDKRNRLIEHWLQCRFVKYDMSCYQQSRRGIIPAQVSSWSYAA